MCLLHSSYLRGNAILCTRTLYVVVPVSILGWATTRLDAFFAFFIVFQMNVYVIQTTVPPPPSKFLVTVRDSASLICRVYCKFSLVALWKHKRDHFQFKTFLVFLTMW